MKDIPLKSTHPSFATLVEVESNLKQLAEKPIRLLWGGRDFCFNKHFLARWQSIFPKAQSTVFKDCGHYLLEDGGREVRDAIVDFLDNSITE